MLVQFLSQGGKTISLLLEFFLKHERKPVGQLLDLIHQVLDHELDVDEPALFDIRLQLLADGEAVLAG